MRKQKCKCKYGPYEIPYFELSNVIINKQLQNRYLVTDKMIFRLRIKALLLNDEFKNYCSHLDKDWEIEHDICGAWKIYGGFPTWATDHKEDYCLISLLFYGNIFQEDIGITWTRFKNAMELTYGNRPFPFCELSTGTPAPPDSRTISFDPGLNHKDLIRLFQGFLSVMKKGDTIKPALSGYFELQPKVKLNEVSRFIAAATRAAELGTKYPKPWLHMTHLYKAYPGSAESKRKTISLDVKKGQNIAYWALRGLFPKTSTPPK
jgi:hypothetical protein